jgi:hypothetical protein
MFLRQRRDETVWIGIRPKVDRRKTFFDGGQHTRRRSERVDVCAEVDYFLGRDPPTPRRLENASSVSRAGRFPVVSLSFHNIRIIWQEVM